MSELLTLKKSQAVKLQAIDVPGFAVSDANPDDWLLQFEGHDKRSVFIMLQKRVLLDLYEVMKKEFEK